MVSRSPGRESGFSTKRKGVFHVAKMAVLVPYAEMRDMARPMAARYGYLSPMCIEYAETCRVQSRARELERQGCELIVARGLQATLARQVVKIPIVEIRVTSQEIGMLALDLKGELEEPCPRIGLVGFSNALSDTASFHGLFGVKLPRYMAESQEELSRFVDKARQEGCHAVIGGEVVCQRARELGLPCRFIPCGRESLEDAFRMASQVGYAIDLEKSSRAEMDTMLSYTFTGIVQLDSRGTVLRANRMAFNMLGLAPGDMLGSAIADVLPELPRSLFDQALHEGKETYAIHVPLHKLAVIVNIAPILVDNAIHGAILTFQEGERVEEMSGEFRRDLYQQGYFARLRFSQLPQESAESKRLIAMAKRVAGCSAPLLLSGEPGCGKAMIAQCIHNESLVRDNAFVPLDCAAFQEDTLDTMLFGNYTNRQSGTLCLAETAQNGTLYLSHIDALSPELQYKVLDLARGRLRHNGSHPLMASNARVIASCDGNLFAKVQEGEFRSDLYYELSALHLRLEPLRRRREDILGWVDMYLEEYQRKHKRYVALTQEARAYLTGYSWPGNLNQLRGLCQRVVLLADKRHVNDLFLRQQLEQRDPEPRADAGPPVYQDQEARRLAELLIKHKGSRQAVAEELGISKTTLWRRMKRLGLGGE